MKPLKISYTYYAKYKDHLYCRVRQAGVKTFDVNLNTTDKVAAENYVRLRRSELELYNRYVMAGEPVPEEVERKLLRRGNPSLPQRGTSEAVSLRKCMDDWEQHLRRLGKRERTIETYCKHVRLTVPLDQSTADFTKANVVTWLSKHDKLKTATRKAYSVATREFAKFLVDRGDIDAKVLTGWPMTKVHTEERGYWSMQEMYRVIEAIKCQDPECEAGMKAFCWLMATTGARQGEAGQLKWSDLANGIITFRAETTKNNVTRRVPLDTRIAEMLLKLPRKGPLIFGTIPPSQPGRYAIVSKAVKRAGVPHGGLHTFRHSASMLMYARTSDIKAVAQYLGHSPAVSLFFYQASRQAEDLKDIVKKTFDSEILLPNPMDDLIKAGLV